MAFYLYGKSNKKCLNFCKSTICSIFKTSEPLKHHKKVPASLWRDSTRTVKPQAPNLSEVIPLSFLIQDLSDPIACPNQTVPLYIIHGETQCDKTDGD